MRVESSEAATSAGPWGDDAAAKATVTSICEEFGWEVSDLGGIECSRYLEPICMAWVHHGLASGSWNHAFKLLRG